MAFTDIDDPTIYFTAFKWTGNGASSRALTGVGFQGNMLWSKPNTGHNHYLVDTVRGVDNKSLIPDANTAEDTTGTHGHFDSIDSDGFTGTLAGGGYNFNRNALEFIAWIWKAGTSFTNDASSTSIGSIDSAGSFNNDAGFSICSYTGNGTAGATIKHGLNSVPSMMIIKDREGAEDWIVFHQSLGNTKFCYLSTNAAAGTDDGAWNDTSPTTSVFTIGDYGNVNNNNHDYICYAFSEKQGYSKFGSYIGNGNADGTFVYTGFKPAFLMIKRTTAVDTWHLVDNKRDPHNMVEQNTSPDTTAADNANAVDFDFLSNGFKLRNNDNNGNNSGDTYIYMAFAENPFVTSTGVPATAR